MEIIYKLESIKDLRKILIDHDVTIRWLKIPDDFPLFYEFLLDQHPSFKFSIEEWKQWEEKQCFYCGLIKNNKIIERAAVEKYSEEKWETADVRVLRAERNKGYARQICFFCHKVYFGFPSYCNLPNRGRQHPDAKGDFVSGIHKMLRAKLIRKRG